MPTLNINTIGSGARRVEVDRIPNECPRCHYSISPNFHVAVQPRDGVTKVFACFACTQEACTGLFVADYEATATAKGPAQWTLKSVGPAHYVRQRFSEEIEQLSPRFALVFNQALAAEGGGLNELVGVGLRKALEFLIKDFLISRAGDDEEQVQAIKKQLLGPCISNRVSSENLKLCAQRAAWLGNDETHYERRWDEHDIEDLKRLVRLSVSWVESELLTANYLTSMPEGRK